jgi:predicted alpha/beta hydrolase family esterase
MPSKRNAKYIEWKIWFEKFFPFLKDDIILIGHSLGAIFLTKYLAENLLPSSIVQLHLVAGVFGCDGGFDILGKLDSIEKQCNQIFIYHSKDDFVVDFEDGKKYAQALPGAKFLIFEDKGHFLQSDFLELVENIEKRLVN